ncbi:MAG: hypothetical protein Q8K05_08990 [Polaromonas sp.]|uniref:hypothetical protein n=1 Tax=Polaromonas sp. TaxID=1869339 RepID=UPI002731C243|nr:hypothetical protein [Polaromonas sp.]MDP2256174.1 hypothetical protein [Polaromonas sp.]MDP3707004.1 hypothetical protein [Polaromonas sp.]
MFLFITFATCSTDLTVTPLMASRTSHGTSPARPKLAGQMCKLLLNEPYMVKATEVAVTTKPAAISDRSSFFRVMVHPRRGCNVKIYQSNVRARSRGLLDICHGRMVCRTPSSLQHHTRNGS